MIWVFGDSYAHQYPGLQDQWMNRIARELDQDIKCFGLVGSSAEYTYTKFYEYEQNINYKDIVIITLTTHSRRWFFKSYPEHTATPDTDTKGYTCTQTSPTNNLKENEALEYFTKYLYNEDAYLEYVTNFLYHLDYLTQKKYLHTIVLINFYDTDNWIKNKKSLWPNIQFSIDKLVTPSFDEYSKDFFYNYDFSAGIKDIRVNHFIKSNHIILAKKIIDNINNNISIDLTNGFIKNVITVDKIKDQNWIKNETFNLAVMVF